MQREGFTPLEEPKGAVMPMPQVDSNCYYNPTEKSGEARTSLTGFTLLEILVVVSLIIMLASLVVGVGMFVHKLVMVKQTENIIHTLALAASSYASDYGGLYPPSHDKAGPPLNDCVVGQGAGVQALCSYIFKNDGFDGLLTGSRSLQKPDYYTKPQDYRNKAIVYKESPEPVDEVDYIVDAWGAPLFYYRPGAPFRNAGSFDLFSAGPDSKSARKIFSPSGREYDYSNPVNAPYYYDKSARQMVQSLPTGDPADINTMVKFEDGATPAGKEAVLDDIGNYKFVKKTN